MTSKTAFIKKESLLLLSTLHKTIYHTIPVSAPAASHIPPVQIREEEVSEAMMAANVYVFTPRLMFGPIQVKVHASQSWLIAQGKWKQPIGICMQDLHGPGIIFAQF